MVTPLSCKKFEELHETDLKNIISYLNFQDQASLRLTHPKFAKVVWNDPQGFKQTGVLVVNFYQPIDYQFIYNNKLDIKVILALPEFDEDDSNTLIQEVKNFLDKFAERVVHVNLDLNGTTSHHNTLLRAITHRLTKLLNISITGNYIIVGKNTFCLDVDADILSCLLQINSATLKYLELTNTASRGLKLQRRLDNVKVLKFEDCEDIADQVFSKISKLKHLYFDKPRNNRCQELSQTTKTIALYSNLSRILNDSYDTLEYLNISDYMKEVVLDRQMKKLAHVELANCGTAFTSSLLKNSTASLTHLDLFCVESELVTTNFDTLKYIRVSQCSAHLVKSIIESSSSVVTHIELRDIISDITINTILNRLTHLVIISCGSHLTKSVIEMSSSCLTNLKLSDYDEFECTTPLARLQIINLDGEEMDLSDNPLLSQDGFINQLVRKPIN